MNCFRVFTVLASLSLALPAQAGLVAEYLQNYLPIHAHAESSFVEGAGAVVSLVTHDDAAVAAPLRQLPSEYYRNTVTATTALVPTAGSGIANGSVAFTFDPGDPGVYDAFSLNFAGTASAASATSAAGDPLNARVVLDARFSMILNPIFGTTLPGEQAGFLYLDALRAADPYETFAVKVTTLGGASIASLLPGAGSLYVPLYAGSAYEFSFHYDIAVPNGIDPPFTLRMGGFIASVPEPASSALMGAGVLIGALAVRGSGRSRQRA